MCAHTARAVRDHYHPAFVGVGRQSRRQRNTDEGAAEVTKGGDDVAQSKNKKIKKLIKTYVARSRICRTVHTQIVFWSRDRSVEVFFFFFQCCVLE